MARHLISMGDLLRDEALAILDLADAFKKAPDRSSRFLAGRSVVLYFSKPSTRTRISFETAIHRLGGLPVSLGPSDMQLGRGETFEDTAQIVSRMSEALVIRTFADLDVERLAAASKVPIINALTDGHHPCQALADLMTLRERFGSLSGLSVAYVGAGNNVAHSLMEACALVGIDVRVGTPRAFAPSEQAIARTLALAKTSGAKVVLTEDPREAVAGADCVYTDTWLSMGDPPEEKEERLQILDPFRVDADLMALASARAVFMHCLPAHRGEEVTEEVMDGPRSIVFDQAENRLHTSLAILETLVGATRAARGSS